MPAPDLYLRLKKKWSEHGRSLNVTLRTLALGSPDGTTGWYAKSFSTSTISMAILYKDTQRMVLRPGLFMAQNAVGITKDTVVEGDEILDANGNTFTVTAVHDHNVLNQFEFNECDLKLQPQAQRSASSWTLWSGPSSPFYRLVRTLEKNAAKSSTVTIYPLLLSTSPDIETGWYAKSYGAGVSITCVILDKQASNDVLRPLGLYTEYTHVGYTQADVNPGDVVKDSFGKFHRIRNPTPRVVADQLVFQELDLELLEAAPFLDSALIPDFMLFLAAYDEADPFYTGSGDVGTITEDGTVYALPTNHYDSKVPHVVEWTPPDEDYTFDHWEGGANITFDDANANPGTAYINSGSSGHIYAIFVPTLYTIGLVVVPDDPCDHDRITLTINGKVYEGPWPKDDTESPGVWAVLATFNHASDELDYWESTGGVAITDPNVNPCSITVTADGSLTCISRSITLSCESAHKTDGGDLNAGKIGYYIGGLGWQWQFDPLPKDAVGWPRGTFSFKWDPKASGKTFDHWEVSGGVTVDDINANPTNVTVTGSGTLRAVYTG